MRESRNGLRPVILNVGDGRGNIVRHEYGYLYGFMSTGSQEEGLFITAIIEMENGNVEEWEATQVKFDDVI